MITLVITGLRRVRLVVKSERISRYFAWVLGTNMDRATMPKVNDQEKYLRKLQLAALATEEVERSNLRYAQLVKELEEDEKAIRVLVSKILKEHKPLENSLSSIEIVKLLLLRIVQ